MHSIIFTVIVEPGPYETPVFSKTAMGADEIGTNSYGAVKETPAKIKAALLSMAGNAQEVADAVLRIIETPAGEKQLRYLVRPASLGVRPDQRPVKASASQPAGSIRPRSRYPIRQR
jgi:hypothetical protein